MTTADDPTEDVAEETISEDDGPKGKKARDWDRIKTERDEARAEMRDMTFEMVGLDPTKGMGKAIATTYEGKYGRAGISDLIEHAQDEYDVELKMIGALEEPDTAKPETSSGEARLKAVDSGSTPVEPDARQAELEQAEAEGDVRKMIATSLVADIESGVIGNQ